MKKIYAIQLIIPVLFLVSICISCDKDNPSTLEEAEKTQQPTENIQENSERYVLMTYQKTVIPAGPMAGKEMRDCYISYFSEMPSGDNVSNIIPYNTLKAHIGKNGGGFLQSANTLYRRSNSATIGIDIFSDLVDNTPVRLEIPRKGLVREIVLKDLENKGISRIRKNFTVNNDIGYMCLASKINSDLYVQTFNASLMSPMNAKILLIRKGEIEKNILPKVLEATPELAGIEFPFVDIGLNFCEMHNGVLIMDITFSTINHVNVSPDIYLIAIAPQTPGEWKELSVIKNTGLIGRTSESSQNWHDEKGNLYILSRGGDVAGFYRNSTISRIKKDAISIDKDWKIAITDIIDSRAARFNGIFVAKDKIITLINNSSLTSTTKDMDLENVWEYYSIDVNTKQAKKIDGLKPCSGFISGANLVSEIDGKYYLRYVRTGNDSPYNGYVEYDLNTNRITPAFNVSEGGYVVDLKKIIISN